MKCRGNEILLEIFHILFRFPCYFSWYISKNRLPLGQCSLRTPSPPPLPRPPPAENCEQIVGHVSADWPIWMVVEGIISAVACLRPSFVLCEAMIYATWTTRYHQPALLKILSYSMLCILKCNNNVKLLTSTASKFFRKMSLLVIFWKFLTVYCMNYVKQEVSRADIK